MKGYIYKYTFPDGKVYIGQTRRDPQLRYEEHIDPITGPTNSGFWAAYQKFGTFKYEILHTIENNNIDELVAGLNYLESKLIIESKAYDPEFGYNKQIIGYAHTDRDQILSAAKRKLMQELLSERLRDFNAIYDKIYKTKEYLTDKEKKYLLNEDKKNFLYHIPEKCKNINKVLKCDKIIEDFWLWKFFDELKFRIQDSAQEEVNGFIVENADPIIEQYRTANTICQLDLDGNVVAEYSSFAEAASALGKSTQTSIRSVVKGKTKTAYGYMWKLKGDIE